MNGNGERTPKIEQFNQAVRGAIVLALVGGMVYGFVVSKVVSTESFLIVANTALIWWFKSRDDEKKASETVDAVKAATDAPKLAVAKAEERAATAEAKVAPAPPPEKPINGG